jgi:Tol biopolymer transport system component
VKGWRRTTGGAVALVLLAASCWLLLRSDAPLPSGLSGGLVFVSDRDGIPALYWRRLPRDRERRLTFGSAPAGEPTVSPDGTRVAFTMDGGLGLVAVATGEVGVLTLGVDWRDASPAWLPDGRRLVVSATRPGEPAGLHLLEPEMDGVVARHPLTRPRRGDDTEPTPSPDGTHVVFVRDRHLFRVDLADGRTRRLTGGFRSERSPRFLSDGRLVCAWSEGKSHGVDVLDADGGRRTLVEGTAVYRTLAPSPDGTFLAATFSHDATLRLLRAFLPHQTEEIRLLGTEGGEAVTLEGSLWHTSHSPDWGR